MFESPKASLAIAAITLAGAHALATDPFPGTLPGVELQQQLPAGYEPSGCVWHPRLHKLFLVSDGGTVSRMDSDGGNVVNWSIAGDLESITLADPNTNIIFIGVEEPPAIIEFNFVSGQQLRRFDLSSWITGPPNELLESIAFIPDLTGTNPEGGVFYAGNQSNGEIHVFSLPIRSSNISTTVTHLSSFSPLPGWGDLADMYYDLSKNLLWAVWDYENVIVLMTPSGSILGQWDLPGFDQEGVAIDGCTLYIGEDSGRVMKYDFIGLGADQDNDGVMDCADDCPSTAAGANVDGNGCSCEQKNAGDSDGDGVANCDDQCANTAPGATVDSSGCSCEQSNSGDDDADGVANCDDKCPATGAGQTVDSDGCSCPQRDPGDSDADGVANCDDDCPDTAAGESVDVLGCPGFPASNPTSNQSGEANDNSTPGQPGDPAPGGESPSTPRAEPASDASDANPSDGASDSRGAEGGRGGPAASEDPRSPPDATALQPVVPAFACGGAGAVSFMTALLLPLALRGRYRS